MYTFEDRNGDRLSLRPEGTAGVVRAVLQNGLLYAQPLRLWYMGQMFRRERPQKGRTRQFHQVGAEVFGAPGPDVDAELHRAIRQVELAQLGEGEVAGADARPPGRRLGGEQLADLVEKAHISGGTGTRGLADRRLIHFQHAVDRLPAAQITATA